MPYFKHGDCNIHYEVCGRGEPLIFLPGWNESINGFRRNVQELLKDDFKLIMLDLPGFGSSDPVELSFENLGRVINGLMDELGVKAAYLAGYCMGGIVALDFTIKNQEKIKKLILIKTFIDFSPVMYPLLIPGINRFILDLFVGAQKGSIFLKKALLDKSYRYSADFFKGMAGTERAVSLGYIRLMWRYSKIDHYKRLNGIGTEIIMISGTRTNPLIVKMEKKILRTCKKCRLIVIDAGNFPVEENALQLAEAIRSVK